MPEPGKLESGKEAQPEDEVLPESTSPTARQAAVVPASEAVAIELPPHAHAEPPGWVYQTFFLLSILQLLFVALTTRYWASVLHWLTFQRNNPIKAGRSIWMYEVLGLTAVHLVIFFFAVTSGLGVFIAATWQKARQNPTGVDERVGFPAPNFLFSTLELQLCVVATQPKYETTCYGHQEPLVHAAALQSPSQASKYCLEKQYRCLLDW